MGLSVLVRMQQRRLLRWTDGKMICFRWEMMLEFEAIR